MSLDSEYSSEGYGPPNLPIVFLTAWGCFLTEAALIRICQETKEERNGFARYSDCWDRHGCAVDAGMRAEGQSCVG